MLRPEDIISAIGVLLGFQITAFSWRISRELSFRDKHDADELRKNNEEMFVTNGIAPSDWLSVLSIILNVFAVLMMLLGGDGRVSLALFGAGLVLFGTYPFAILGHYRMFVRTQHKIGSQKNATTSEVVLICFGMLGALLTGLFIVCAN
ncbi:MAG: hypothetical protein JST38_15065 [Bacteroidetes bacterium]|nr:hypothetical protein [Bacteroidota bacterium]